MTDLIERKALKLLMQANQRLSELAAEGLCDRTAEEAHANDARRTASDAG